MLKMKTYNSSNIVYSIKWIIYFTIFNVLKLSKYQDDIFCTQFVPARIYINGDSFISGRERVDPGPWVEDQPRGKLLIRPTHLKTRPSPVLIRTRPIPGTSWSNSPNPRYIISRRNIPIPKYISYSWIAPEQLS